MKRITILALSFFIIVVSYSQKREDEKPAVFKSKSAVIASADGWKKNKTTGKWIKNKSFISDNVYEEPLGHALEQNFFNLQLCVITVDGKDIYGLLYSRKSGYYKYPNLEMDWVPDTMYKFLLFDEKEYRLLRSNADIQNKIFKVKSKSFDFFRSGQSHWGGEYEFTEENLLARIKSNWNREKSKYSTEYCFYFKSEIIDGVEIVRFQLPKFCSSSDEKDFENEYFEIPKKEFLKLFDFSPTFVLR